MCLLEVITYGYCKISAWVGHPTADVFYRLAVDADRQLLTGSDVSHSISLCFREVAALHSDHLRQVPLSSLSAPHVTCTVLLVHPNATRICYPLPLGDSCSTLA